MTCPIQDYQMKEGDYKILVTIYEAQELEPQKAKLFNFFDMNKSAVDGFVQIEIMGQTRRTAVRRSLFRFARKLITPSGRNRSTFPSKT